jgi:hypothetical protein
MSEAALQCVEVFAHQVFVARGDSLVQLDADSHVPSRAPSLAEVPTVTAALYYM